MKTLVIIPAYNEEKNIYAVVKSVKNSCDILVINDGSIDGTCTEAERAGANVLNLISNLGIGGAVQTGYLYAYYHDYDAVVQIDGDGQHNPEDLHKFIEIIDKDEADMVIGSRFLDAKNYNPGPLRRIGISYFSTLISCLCKKDYYDTTSGYRMVNKRGIELFAGYYPQDYPEGETIVYAERNNMRVKEIKVNMNKRQGGNSSITAAKSFYYMIKVTCALLLQPKRKGVLQ